MSYASVDELRVLLTIDSPTTLQADAMKRCIDAAGQEIDWELGYTSADPAPDPVPPLVVEVCLERATEHWRQSYSPFGIIPMGAESTPIVSARNSWYRHHLKLAPLKTPAGIA